VKLQPAMKIFRVRIRGLGTTNLWKNRVRKSHASVPLTTYYCPLPIFKYMYVPATYLQTTFIHLLDACIFSCWTGRLILPQHGPSMSLVAI